MYTDLLYFNWMFMRPLCIRAQYDQYQVTAAAFLPPLLTWRWWWCDAGNNPAFILHHWCWYWLSSSDIWISSALSIVRLGFAWQTQELFSINLQSCAVLLQWAETSPIYWDWAAELQSCYQTNILPFKQFPTVSSLISRIINYLSWNMISLLHTIKKCHLSWGFGFVFLICLKALASKDLNFTFRKSCS